MKKLTIILYSILTTTVVFGQQTKNFTPYIVKNSDWKQTSKTQWEFELKAEKGSLNYVGVEHLDDPKHPQFEKIKRLFANFQPTVAFYEGPNRGIADSDTLTIKKFGETGYVRYLAAQAGIKIMGLEPSPVDLYRYLCSKFSQEKVDLYMLTKEAMRLRTRKNYTQSQIEAETINLLQQFQKMLAAETKIKSIGELEKACKANFKTKLPWWQLPIEWFDPQKQDRRFTNQLAVLSSEYRDVYMVGVLSDQVNRGERVFAVVGRNHVPLQMNAIRYAVGLPILKNK